LTLQSLAPTLSKADTKNNAVSSHLSFTREAKVVSTNKPDLKLFNSKRERGRIIQNLRVVVDYRVLPGEIHVSRSVVKDAIKFQWLLGESADPKEVPYVDPEALLEAFYAVNTPDMAETFLQASGPFRTDAIEVTWDHFQQWQSYFKTQRRLGAAGKGWGTPPEYKDPDLLDRIVRVPKLEPLTSPQGHPVLAARAFCTVECIAAILYLERWSNTVVLSCRQCGDPFVPKTKASVFCKHSCAHTYWRAHGRSSNRRGGRNVKAAK